MTQRPSADRIPISALQHYAYCPRQCALIHVEQTYEENVYTLRGNRAHRNVDDPGDEIVAGKRRETSLPVWSEEYGLTGKADVVVFRDDEPPYPIEYKAGDRKQRDADDIQLCAQALCLEEMFQCEILEGAVYHRRSRRRRDVQFTEELRSQTRQTAHAVHQLLDEQTVPSPVADERCPKCSLVETCMPFALNRLQEGEET